MPENDKLAAEFMQERGFIFFLGTDYTDFTVVDYMNYKKGLHITTV